MTSKTVAATSTTQLGILFALGATVLWSMNFIVARGVADLVPPAALSWWRWVVASVALLPFAAKACWQQRQILARHWRYIGACGLVGIALFNLFLYRAAHSAEAFNLSLIAISSPIWMLLLSALLFGERLTSTRLLGTGVTLMGVLLLLTQGDLGRLLQVRFGVGELWGLASAAMFACYSMLLKAKPAALSPLPFLLASFVAGLLLLTPAYLWELSQGLHAQWQARSVAGVLYIGIGASLMAFFLWNRAVALIGPASAGSVYYSLPLFAGLAATLMLDEPIGWLHGICSVLIIGGIVLANRR